MGIILSAIGYDDSIVYSSKAKNAYFLKEDTERILDYAKEMTKGIIRVDFKNLESKENLTHGERLYLQHGFTGIRGEAEKGYPILRDFALPKLRALHDELTLEDQMLEILITIMSESEDSNIIARGGIEALYYVQKLSKEFLKDGGMRNPEARRKLNEMNMDFKRRNLSPGGSADLLSLAIFFGKLEGLIK